MAGGSALRIGLDLDNTIAGYDHVFVEAARDMGLLNDAVAATKKEVRDHIRGLHGGEQKWMRLQAVVYGERMGEARLIDGVDAFLRRCRDGRVPIFIVSHKTRFSAADPGGVDLRAAALTWMDDNGFFREDGFALARSNVFFESTRQAKCARISHLALTDFVDDLEEVFLEPTFPKKTRKFLLHRGVGPAGPRTFRVVRSWPDLEKAILGDA
jgi:hypothetical protein